MNESSQASRGTGRTIAAIATVLACALLTGAVAWHVRAETAYRASLAKGIHLETRFSHAYTATALEPWNARYSTRGRHVTAWLRADRLLAGGDYKDAVNLLAATIGRTLAEPDLLALYRKAQEIQAVDTNRKAHLQHGHEGPGGTLAPTDVER